MKRIILSILILGIFSLCACRPSNIGICPDNSIDPPDNIYIGMPREDFFAIYPDKPYHPDETCFSFWGEYAFLEDTEGNPVVVQFERDNGWYVASVDAYDKDTISVTAETFSHLERGMSVQEIVSRLGCPYPRLNGVNALEYKVGDDMYYLRLARKTHPFDTEYVFVYFCILHPDNSLSYPMGSEPWEYVDPE